MTVENVQPSGFVTADDAFSVEPPASDVPAWALYVGVYSANGMTLYFRDVDDLRRLHVAIGEALPDQVDRAPSATSHPQGVVIPDGSS